MRNVLVAVLLAFTASVCAQEAKPPELTPEEQKLAEAASKLGNDGVTLRRWRSSGSFIRCQNTRTDILIFF